MASNARKESTHHAQCLIGGAVERDNLISSITREYDLHAGDPDFFVRTYDTLTIEDAREIKSLAGTRPVRDDGLKIFVLTMNGVTVEAQNALLKLLEEPGEYARFYIVIPSARLLIPTIVSRLNFIGDHNGSSLCDAASTDLAKAFLAAPTQKRLDMVKALMDEITKEKKQKQDAVNLIRAIETALYSAGGVKKNSKALEAVVLAEKYATDRAPSLKMLLEYIALTA